MRSIDWRDEFCDVPWQQGRLLLTETTRCWSKELRDTTDARERCGAYAYFSAQDEGRGRMLVFVYPSAAECEAAVKIHNEAIINENQ